MPPRRQAGRIVSQRRTGGDIVNAAMPHHFSL